MGGFYGTFESVQTVEIVTEHNSNEINFTIGLYCTANSAPPSFNPMDGGDPGWGPEFDVDYVWVDPIGRISWKVFEGLVGLNIACELFAKATVEASESGEF